MKSNKNHDFHACKCRSLVDIFSLVLLSVSLLLMLSFFSEKKTVNELLRRNLRTLLCSMFFRSQNGINNKRNKENKGKKNDA